MSTTYNLSPRLLLGLAYIYTWGAYTPSDTRPKWHQINIGADYFLSKRTDLYVTGIYQRAAGDAQFAQIYTLLPSSGRSRLDRGGHAAQVLSSPVSGPGACLIAGNFLAGPDLAVNHIDVREYNI